MIVSNLFAEIALVVSVVLELLILSFFADSATVATFRTYDLVILTPGRMHGQFHD